MKISACAKAIAIGNDKIRVSVLCGGGHIALIQVDDCYCAIDDSISS